jgi:hypothetical protein
VPDATVSAILRDFAGGDVSMLALSRRYGFGESTVRDIVTGRTHVEVPGPRLSPERIAELAAKHVAEGRRRAGYTQKKACPGCGQHGHAITKCPDPRGR